MAFWWRRGGQRHATARGHGARFSFTAASASVEGDAQSADFAWARLPCGLAQAMARELQPKGIRVACCVVGGGVANPERARLAAPARRDELPDPIA